MTVLASFNGSNGFQPYGDLTVVGNTLYGTTFGGGDYGKGTVFSLPLSGGSPTVLASFSGSNGEYPEAGLTVVGNNLYGTTYSLNNGMGGGTVFSLPLSGGSPTVLASFSGFNGSGPQADLTVVGNSLYGTTRYGGNGFGTVFGLPLSGGTPIALASFNNNNGRNPEGGLTVVGNSLYGTATAGGAHGDYGTVFSLPLSGGSLTVLSSFNGSNALYPTGDLVVVGSNLYGTTVAGPNFGNYGTVFSLPLSGGSPTILASFSGSNGYSATGLIVVGNSLYGMTSYGGAGFNGNADSGAGAGLRAEHHTGDNQPHQPAKCHNYHRRQRHARYDAKQLAKFGLQSELHAKCRRHQWQCLAWRSHSHVRQPCPRRQPILHRLSFFHRAGRQYALLHCQ